MLGDISNYRLRVFCEVMDSGGFNAAAKILNISQPAVSAHIRAIEGELGVQILERTKEIRLTEAGTVLYRYAKTLLNENHLTNQIIDELRYAKSGLITLGVSYMFTRGKAASLLAEFKKENQQVEMILYSGNTSDIFQMIYDRKIDFGFVISRPEYKCFSVQTMGNNEFIFAVGVAHPLFGRKEVFSVAEISEYAFILPTSRPSGYPMILREMLSDRGIEVGTPTIEVDDNQLRDIMIKEGLGIGIIPEQNYIEELQAGIIHRISLDIKPMIIPVYFVHRVDKSFSPSAQKFLRFYFPRFKK